MKPLLHGLVLKTFYFVVWTKARGKQYGYLQSHNRLKNSQWYRDAFEVDSFKTAACATDVLWEGNHNLDVALNNLDGGYTVRVASILTSNELHVLALQKAMGRLSYGCVRRFLREKCGFICLGLRAKSAHMLTLLCTRFVA